MKKLILLLLFLLIPSICFSGSAQNNLLNILKSRSGGACDVAQQTEDGGQEGPKYIGRFSSTYWATKFNYSGTTGKAICQIDLWLSKVLSPSDNYYVAIWGHDGTNTEPDSANVIGTCDALDSSTVGASEGRISITCTTPTGTLTNGTDYWVVFYRPGGADDTNYLIWHYDEGTAGTKDVDASTDSGATWADDAAVTLKFKLWSQ